jgi:4-diphosphocytidyl-2-C-methyl-D-erythritol kinase
MLKLRSPAKINLFLRVTGRYPNGYHSLASLFQVISLSDYIHFALHSPTPYPPILQSPILHPQTNLDPNANLDHLTCTDPSLPTDNTNLILKAADLFRRKTGLNFRLQAHLEKNIPHQAGFGGGSGNAATTLWALNILLRQNIPETILQEWSAEIGSDIPFFFAHGTAYCTGRGEIVERLPAIQNVPLWVVKPKIGLSTPAVFKQLQLNELPPREPLHFLKEFSTGNMQCFNDLEEAAFSVHPPLRSLKNLLLDSGFHTVVMTGSGSGFFCLGDATPPSIEDLVSYPVSYLNRTAETWYT